MLKKGIVIMCVMNDKINDKVADYKVLYGRSPAYFKSKYCIACQAKNSNYPGKLTYVGLNEFDGTYSAYQEFCNTLMFNSNVEAIEFYNKNKDSFPYFHEDLFQWIKVVRVELYDDLHTLWVDK